jgi:hypothetical protein
MKKLAIVILSLTAAVSAFAQTKTVTNEDLEKFRQQRLESERKLKEKYAELGITPAQIEKQNQEQRAALDEYSAQLRAQRIASQNDIITQANALRLEIAAVDAQINYLRGQYNGSDYKGGTVSIYGYAPFGYAPYGLRGGNRSVLPQLRNLPPNARTVQEYALGYPNTPGFNSQLAGRARLGGRIGGIGLRPGYGRNGYYRGGYVAPVILGGSYQSGELASPLTILEQQRAGLLARWNILAEQARRAGIRLD